MRTSTLCAFAATIVVSLVLSSALNAAKFSCEILKGSALVKTCTVDSTTLTPCTYNFSATLVATCQGGSISSSESELVCYFADPTAPALKFDTSPTLAAAAKTLAEQPGFRATAIEWITSSAAMGLSLNYTEQSGAPADSALCTPTGP